MAEETVTIEFPKSLIEDLKKLATQKIANCDWLLSGKGRIQTQEDKERILSRKQFWSNLLQRLSK